MATATVPFDSAQGTVAGESLPERSRRDVAEGWPITYKNILANSAHCVKLLGSGLRSVLFAHEQAASNADAVLRDNYKCIMLAPIFLLECFFVRAMIYRCGKTMVLIMDELDNLILSRS
jgi:hypothetical protein